MYKILVVSVLLAFSVALSGQNKSIKFVNNSFEKAKTEAEKTGKLIFVDAYTTWCGPCKWMAANMFTEPSVAAYYNSNFVNLKLDMEKGEGKEFAEKYSVRAYPTLLFIDATGALQHRKVGTVQQAEAMINLGKLAQDAENNLAGMRKKYEGGEQGAEFMMKYLKVIKEAGQQSKEVLNTYYESLDPMQFEEEDVFELITSYDRSIDSKAMKYISENREKFSALYAEQLDDLLHDNYLYWVMEKASGKHADRKEMEKRMIKVKKLNIPEWEKIILIVDLSELKKEKRMDEYVDIAVADVGEYFSDEPYSLNSFAWTVFEHSSDKQQLEEALNWANTALESANTHMILDTKANILYKLERTDEAIETQKKAIESAKEAGASDDEIKSYTKTLKSFK